MQMLAAMIGLSSFYCVVAHLSPVVRHLMQWNALSCPDTPFNVCLRVMY